MISRQPVLFVPHGPPSFALRPGAAGDPAKIQRFHAGIEDHVIAMDAYAFLPTE